MGFGHHHHHSHEHRPQQRKALLWCVIITGAMMAVEFVAGYFTHSLLLYSDALHMLSHSVALAVSWYAIRLAARPRTEQYTFGLGKAELLGAFFNGIGLIGFVVWIVWESVDRLWRPVAILEIEMLTVASAGLLVNILTTMILYRSGAEDLNTRSAFLHMLADLLGSVAAIVGGLLVYWFDWLWVDPALSLLLSFLIVRWGVSLLRESTHGLMGRSPLPVREVRDAILDACPQAQDVHALHVIETTPGNVFVAATVHLRDGVAEEGCDASHRISQALHDRFGVHESVIEIHTGVCDSANAEHEHLHSHGHADEHSH